MQSDEENHKNHAIEAGAKNLPPVVKKLMSMVSGIMVKTAYWV